MLPHARPGGIAGFMELLADRGGRDDLYKLADELAMDVDDLLPIVDASVMLGFAVLHEGDVEITPEGRAFGEADIQTQKQIFREAALKNIAILRLIENTLHAKRDHAIGEEFFRDILDEHFSADEVERQFETALNWGRYAEIFDYDSETGRLFHREEADADAVPIAGRELMARSTWQPIRILGKGPWSLLPAQTWSVLTDFVIFAAGLSIFYAVLVLARTWFGPFNPHVEISRDPTKLPMYAAYSLLRITVAYVLSLAFTLVYGYVAAYNPRAERIMIPLLDILQSIPVLSFLPGVMLAMVALFPHHQIGVEMGAILLIFTGQVWNMAFSFYSSLKSIPRDMREAAKIYRFNWYQRFTQFELPYAAIGLVWNSMMSVAGGWFFLMACEMFVLGVARLSPARTGFVSANRSQRGRHASDSLGRRRHDRGDRAARPDRVAAGDRVGREVQDGAGGERRRAALVVSQCHASARAGWCGCARRRDPAAARAAGAALRPAASRRPRTTLRRRPGRSGPAAPSPRLPCSPCCTPSRGPSPC